MRAWERLVETGRLDAVDLVAHAMARCCSTALQTLEANERSRREMQLDILRLLDGDP